MLDWAWRWWRRGCVAFANENIFGRKELFSVKVLLQRITRIVPAFLIIQVLRTAVWTASRKGVSCAHVCEFSHMNKSTIKQRNFLSCRILTFLSAWIFLSGEKEHPILSPAASCCLYCLPNWKLQHRCAKKDILWAYLKGELSNQGNNFMLSVVRRAWLNRILILLLGRAKEGKEKSLWQLKVQYINIHIFCVQLFCSLLQNYLPLIWIAEVRAFCFYHCYRLNRTWVIKERSHKIPG